MKWRIYSEDGPSLWRHDDKLLMSSCLVRKGAGSIALGADLGNIKIQGSRINPFIVSLHFSTTYRFALALALIGQDMTKS